MSDSGIDDAAARELMIDVIFTKLAARYGSLWVERWRGINIQLVRMDWLRELHGVSAAEVEFGLRYLPMDRPPTVTEFRAICHRAPQTAPARQMIAGPRPDLQRLREQLGKLRDVLVSAKRPKRQWIDDLLAKQRRGEELSVAQRINLALALRAPALDEDGDRDKLDRRKQETQRMVERYLRGTQ